MPSVKKWTSLSVWESPEGFWEGSLNFWIVSRALCVDYAMNESNFRKSSFKSSLKLSKELKNAEIYQKLLKSINESLIFHKIKSIKIVKYVHIKIAKISSNSEKRW